MKLTIVEENIPAGRGGESISWVGTLNDFLDSGLQEARIELPEGASAKNLQPGAYAAIKRNDLPIKLHRRGAALYAERLF